jgi:hypothetical protein
MPDAKDPLYKRVPNRASVEVEAFVQRGPAAASETQAVVRSLPPAEPEKKTGLTYKHKERNNALLKDLGNLLGRNMGELLDEAIEGMLETWKQEAATKRNVPVTMIEQLLERS